VSGDADGKESVVDDVDKGWWWWWG
jgi:hypothetical protein